MYFPTSAARQLSSVPALPLPSELVQSIVPSPRKTLFAAITKSGLSLWRVRVCPTSRTLSPLSEAECVLWSWMDAALRGSRAPLAHADVSAGTWREPAHSVVSGRAETCHPGAHDRRHTIQLSPACVEPGFLARRRRSHTSSWYPSNTAPRSPRTSPRLSRRMQHGTSCLARVRRCLCSH